jgi:hypothetical protein
MRNDKILREWTTETDRAIVKHIKREAECWCCHGKPDKCEYCASKAERRGIDVQDFAYDGTCTECKGKGKIIWTKTQTSQKFLCVGGLNAGERLTAEGAGEQYIMYNAANFNRGRTGKDNKLPRVILVCLENILK